MLPIILLLHEKKGGRVIKSCAHNSQHFPGNSLVTYNRLNFLYCLLRDENSKSDDENKINLRIRRRKRHLENVQK
jgi:hypothetical protein